MKLKHLGLYARITIGVLSVVALTAGVWISRENSRLHQAYLNERSEDIEIALHVKDVRLKQSIETLRQDVVFLANTPPVFGLIRATANRGFDPIDNNPYEKWEARLQEIFSAFLRAHPDYFQVRYIGVANGGRELVRVERHDSRIVVSARSDLQAKGERDYFKFGLGKKAGEVYLSEFNLNQEQGKIVQPIQPALRAVTPVIDKSGAIFGVIVINQDARTLFSSVVRGLPEGVRTYLADRQGNYLYHPDEGRGFAFETGGNTSTIIDDFPVLKPMFEPQGIDFLSLTSLSDSSKDDHLAAERISFDEADPSRFLLLAYHLPEDIIKVQSRGLSFPSLLDMLLAMALVGAGGILVLRRAFLPLRRITGIAREIAAGRHEMRLTERGGEIGELAEAINTMLDKLSETELIKLENTFRKELIDALPGVFYMISRQGRFLMWNHNLEHVTERNSAELGQISPLDLFRGEDKSRIEKAIQAVFETGEVSVEAVLVAKSGTGVSYHFTGKRILREGEPVLVGMGLDITKQRENMRATESLLRRNQSLMQNSMDGVHVMDINGNVLEVNEAFCRMLGYSREEALRLNVKDWDSHFSAKELEERLPEFIGKSGMFETVHKRKDGSLLDVEICTTGVEVDGKGYLYAASRDITERKRLQNILQRNKQVIETTHDGYWLTDMRGNLLEVNQAYADISGYTVEELVGMHISQLEAKEKTLDEVKSHIAKVIAQGYDVFETQHRHKDGRVIDIEISTTYMHETEQLVVFCRDISERRRAEQELRIAAAAFETHDAILITDANSNIIRVNHAFTTITGYSAERCWARIRA